MSKVFEILNAIRPEYDFTASSDYIEDGLLDSFDIAILVTTIENEFDIVIDGEDVIPENFINIHTIEDFIHKSSHPTDPPNNGE